MADTDDTAPNPTGSNEPQTTAEEILDAMEPGEPYSTMEIQEMLGLAQSTANYRLNKMADNGQIRKKKPGHRTVIWMLPVGGDDE